MKKSTISTIAVAMLIVGGCSSYPASQSNAQGQADMGASKGQAMISPPIGGMGSNTTRDAVKAEELGAAKAGSLSKGQAMISPPIGGMGSNTTRDAVKAEAASSTKSTDGSASKGEIGTVPAK